MLFLTLQLSCFVTILRQILSSSYFRGLTRSNVALSRDYCADGDGHAGTIIIQIVSLRNYLETTSSVIVEQDSHATPHQSGELPHPKQMKGGEAHNPF